MSTDPDTTRIVRSWLMADEHESATAVVEIALAEIETTQQHRATWWPVRRTPTMNKILGFGLAAAAVVAVVFIGSQVIDANPSGLGADPTPIVTPDPTPTPVPSLAEPSSSTDGSLPEGPFELSRPRPYSDVIAMTVIIPSSGWSQLVDFNFLKKGNGVDLAEALVMPMPHPAGTEFYVPADPCQSISTRPETAVTTVDDLVAALAAQASRDASEPVDVMVGGYAGKSITLHVPDDAPFDGETFNGCEDGIFISYDTEQSGYLWHHRPGQIDDLWIVDVDGVIVVIDAEYGPDTPADLVEEMRTLAQSVTFGTP